MKKPLRLLNSINDRFWAAVGRATANSVESLCVFRIIAGLSLLLVYAYSYGWIGDMPKAFFQPPILSPVNIFTRGFPDKGFFMVLDSILIVTAICITLGIRARIATIIYVIVAIACVNFECSFGKIGHTIFLYILLGCMAFSDWGTKLALYPDKPKDVPAAKLLGLLAVTLCFGFFTAGYEKSLNWINFDFTTSGSARWFYNSYFNLDRSLFLAPYFAAHTPFWAFKLMDYTAVAFEYSPLFFLISSRRSWRVFLLIASCFHLVNTLVFNISFIGNGLVYLSFLNFEGAYNYLEKLFAKKSILILITVVMVLIVAIRLKSMFAYTKTMMVFLPSQPEIQLYGILGLWLTVVGSVLYSVIETRSQPKLNVRPKYPS